MNPFSSAVFAALLALGGFAAPAVRAEPLEKITIATMPITPNAPLLVAKERGYFRDAGLDAEIATFQSAQDIVLAVSSGAAQVGNGGLTAGFYNIAGKGGLRIVAAQSREEKGFHNNAFVVTQKAYDSGLKTLKDLPGHRVGINAAGSTQHYAVGLVAQKFGYDLSAVTIVPLQNYPNLIAAFKGGQIDSMIASVNIAQKLVGEGSGQIIGWSGDETPWQLGVVMTRPQFIEKDRPLLEKYLAVFLRAAAEYHAAFNQLDKDGKPIKGPGYDAWLADISKILHQPESEIAKSLPYVDPKGALDVGDIYNQVTFWQKAGLAAPSVKANTLVDLSFVKGHFDLPK